MPFPCKQTFTSLEALAASPEIGAVYLASPNALHCQQALPDVGKLRTARLSDCQYSSRYPRYLNGEKPNTFDPRWSNGSGMDIGIGFAFAGTTNEVVNACTTGREGQCRKVAFKEYAKFAFSTGGGMAGGAWGSSAMIGVCAAVGVATVGVGGVACAAVGSIAGGYAGSVAGEKLVNMFLE